VRFFSLIMNSPTVSNFGTKRQGDIGRFLHRDQFRPRLDEMLSWLENARPTTVEVVILKQELEDWLTNHISTIDVKLRGCK
jgi:hypothetical protein